MFGKKAVAKELELLSIAANEVITELLLECESLAEYSEVLGAIRMARELGLITNAERDNYENEAYEKHTAFKKRKEEERKRKAAEYKAERAEKAKAAREKLNSEK